MKILDRYVIFTFLKNYFLAFFVLIGLYIVLDAVFQFDNIVGVAGTEREGFASVIALVGAPCDHYFYQSLVIFVHLAGIIPGVAASFTLLRMTRNNELTAMLAAGVPLIRIAMPIILMAVMLTGLVIVDQETIIPRVVPQLTQKIDDLKRPEKTFPIPAMQEKMNDDGTSAVLTCTRYHPPTIDKPARMQVVDIIKRKKDFQPFEHTWADTATWDEVHQQWNLSNGFQIADVLLGTRGQTPVPQQVYKSDITPETIALFQSAAFVDLLSIHKINELLDPTLGNSYGSRDLLRAKHTRVTQWLMNIVLLLLSIPAVLTREPGALRAASIKCLVLTGACLGLIALSNNLAGQPPPDPRYNDLWPALMSWFPVFIFGPLSIWLLDRVKT